MEKNDNRKLEIEKIDFKIHSHVSGEATRHAYTTMIHVKSREDASSSWMDHGIRDFTLQRHNSSQHCYSETGPDHQIDHVQTRIMTPARRGRHSISSRAL